MSRLFPAASSSHAPFSVRPDARPLKRIDSAVSLPSPPMSRAEFLNERDQAPLAALQFPPSPEHSNEDEPMNLDAPGANPFRAQNLKSTRPERPDHPSASPTQHVRKQRRIDKDRILLLKKEPEALLGMGRGWDSPSNPFIERPGEAAQRQDRVKAPKPEKMTYVLYVRALVRWTLLTLCSTAAGSASSTTFLSTISSCKTPTNRLSQFLPPACSSPPHPSRPPPQSRPSPSWTRCARSSARSASWTTDSPLRPARRTANV